MCKSISGITSAAGGIKEAMVQLQSVPAGTGRGLRRKTSDVLSQLADKVDELTKSAEEAEKLRAAATEALRKATAAKPETLLNAEGVVPAGP